MSERVALATDGSCLRNPGPGGWAWATEDGRQGSGGHADTTNNLMELRAVYEALGAFPSDTPLLIQADSMYVINIFTRWLSGWRAKGWKTAAKKPVLNREAIEMIADRLDGRDVRWEHVKGHSGHPLNELVDTLARTAAEQIRDQARTS